MPRLLSCCLLLLVFLAPQARAEGTPFKPFDEAGQDPAFQAFRDDLLAAVKRRDLEAVVHVAAADILLSYGEDTGPERLREWLAGQSSEVDAAYLWGQLEDVLAHGGGWDQQGGFGAPYWFAGTPQLPDDTDWYEVLYVVGEKVRMRAGAGTDKAVLGTASYEVVFADDPDHVWETDGEGKEWLYVRTTDNRKGWIRGDFLRGPFGYRAGFEQRDGRWKLTYFLAGD